MGWPRKTLKRLIGCFIKQNGTGQTPMVKKKQLKGLELESNDFLLTEINTTFQFFYKISLFMLHMEDKGNESTIPTYLSFSVRFDRMKSIQTISKQTHIFLRPRKPNPSIILLLLYIHTQFKNVTQLLKVNKCLFIWN